MFTARANVSFTVDFTINGSTKFLYCQYKMQIQNILANIYSLIFILNCLFGREEISGRVVNVFSFSMWARFFSETNIMVRRKWFSSATSITSETCQNCIAHYLREHGISKNALTFKRRIVEGKQSTRRRSASGLAALVVYYTLIRYKDSRRYFAWSWIAYRLRTQVVCR